jgi:hypothetical protein
MLQPKSDDDASAGDRTARATCRGRRDVRIEVARQRVRWLDVRSLAQQAPPRGGNAFHQAARRAGLATAGEQMVFDLRGLSV